MVVHIFRNSNIRHGYLNIVSDVGNNKSIWLCPCTIIHLIHLLLFFLYYIFGYTGQQNLPKSTNRLSKAIYHFWITQFISCQSALEAYRYESALGPITWHNRPEAKGWSQRTMIFSSLYTYIKCFYFMLVSSGPRSCTPWGFMKYNV